MSGHAWKPAEVASLINALAVASTATVAKRLGISPKSIRSLLLARGVSIRALRRPAPSERALGGLVARRSIASPPAVFGAEALARLPDKSCSWPIGDPVAEGFAFCGAPIEGRGPYCAARRARAYLPPQLLWSLASAAQVEPARPKQAGGASSSPHRKRPPAARPMQSGGPIPKPASCNAANSAPNIHQRSSERYCEVEFFAFSSSHSSSCSRE